MINSLRTIFSFQKKLKNDLPRKDYTLSLPQELILEIFSYLNCADLERCRLVNKRWEKWASHDSLWKNPSAFTVAFGKKEWEKYFGDVGEEPLVSLNMRKVLKRPCPFWRKKRVEETHMLVLIPVTINGAPLSLRKWAQIIQHPKAGKALRDTYLRDFWLESGMIQTAKVSYWVLMTRDVIPGSKNRSFEDQKTMISHLAHRIGVNYEIPHALDASICIAISIISKKRKFPSKTFSSCQENGPGEIFGYAAQTVVGNWLSYPYCSWYYMSPHKQLGVAPIRKLN